MRLPGLLIALAACGGADPSSPDGTPPPDQTPTQDGLRVTWSADPALPGVVLGSVTITDVAFHGQMKVIGDATTDGSATTSDVDLEWSAAGQPADVTFAQAPSGRYSKVAFDLDPIASGKPAFVIAGNATVDGATHPFALEDDVVPLRISVDCNTELDANSAATIALSLQLGGPLLAVNFSSLPDDNGTLVLDDQTAAQFVQQILHAFHSGDDDAH
ncbi:MAG TPA: hypothetical protein VGM88_23370 [Kofleriaceae bacterium]|jgi:hypothetical protein